MVARFFLADPVLCRKFLFGLNLARLRLTRNNLEATSLGVRISKIQGKWWSFKCAHMEMLIARTMHRSKGRERTFDECMGRRWEVMIMPSDSFLNFYRRMDKHENMECTFKKGRNSGEPGVVVYRDVNWTTREF